MLCRLRDKNVRVRGLPWPQKAQPFTQLELIGKGPANQQIGCLQEVFIEKSCTRQGSEIYQYNTLRKISFLQVIIKKH